MNPKTKNIFYLAILLIFFLSACGGNKPSTLKPESVVESYLQALVAKDGNTLSALSCKDWETSAAMELDSFAAVKVRLDGLTCKQTGTDGSEILVSCLGKIIATYNGEDQSIDLSTRSYRVIDQNGENLVCGYK